MIVTLEEMKTYLRVDFDDDDSILSAFIESAQALCMDIARIEDADDFAVANNSRIAVMYAVAYFYEHREEADYHELTMTLRALLFGSRKEVF